MAASMNGWIWNLSLSSEFVAAEAAAAAELARKCWSAGTRNSVCVCLDEKQSQIVVLIAEDTETGLPRAAASLAL